MDTQIDVTKTVLTIGLGLAILAVNSFLGAL